MLLRGRDAPRNKSPDATGQTAVCAGFYDEGAAKRPWRGVVSELDFAISLYHWDRSMSSLLSHERVLWEGHAKWVHSVFRG